MPDPATRLTAALADRYRVERELGAGGMATVYLAEDLKHHRHVALKVLRPDLAASLGAARFLREIEIAARLQHPHILPLLDSGEVPADQPGEPPLLYYVMPFVEGESLRDRLVREGELPTADAERVLRDVADALSYAHARGVVHRDIKPDNVMLSGRHALVMDFGVARALAEGRTPDDPTITTVGLALGTPAYMSPEQASADPNVDHRADIYAVGVMAYEMLTGRPPFNGHTPQQILAAQVTEAPDPVTKRRPAVPPGLADVVMRCLAKRPADRWQSADELLANLQPVTTPGSGTVPTTAAPASKPATSTDGWYGHPVRVAALFLLSALAVLGVVYFLTIQLGLPYWVLGAAGALLLVGLPIMVVTGLIERRRARVPAQTSQTFRSGGWRGWVTWRRAVLGGILAFAVLGVVILGYTAMRLLGIGPVGTVMAKGSLAARDRVLVAEFENRTADTTLGLTVTEAFRIDLAQSPLISVLSSGDEAEAIKRMERDPGRITDVATAREVALRAGGKAVVVGDIGTVGKGYVLSARLIAATDGQELVAIRETADDEAGILKAIDRLSKSLRGRIGESLRTIRANEPLEQVTTASLPALRLYTMAEQATGQGNPDAAIGLLEQAIATDTGFAMAYRKLAVHLGNLGINTRRMVEASTRAYQHRDRLPEIERYLASAYYFDVVENDPDQAAAAYRSVLQIDPNNPTALNNLGVIVEYQRQWPEAESLFTKAARNANTDVMYWGMFRNQMTRGHVDQARATLSEYASAIPDSPRIQDFRAQLAAMAGAYDSAQSQYRDMARRHPSPSAQVMASVGLAEVALVQGKLAEAEGHLRQVMVTREKMGLPAAYLSAAADLASVKTRLSGNPSAAVATIDSALRRYPWDSISPLDRPAPYVAAVLAEAGKPQRAHQIMAEYEASVPEHIRRGNRDRLRAAGIIALADGRPQDAITSFRAYNDVEGTCTKCGLPDLARAYDQAGQQDSAIAVYERFLAVPGAFILDVDQWDLARGLKRLGELYEERGDRAKALEYYSRFVRLWKDADAELQPIVKEVRQRIAQLTAEPKG